PIVVWALGVHPERRTAAKTAQGGGPGGWKLSEGWRAIRDDRRILAMVVAQIVVALACGAGFRTLTVYSMRTDWGLSSETAGTMMLATNGCMLVGNLLVAQRATFRPRLSLAVGTVVRALSLFLLLAPSWPVFVAALAVGAVGEGAVVSTAVMMRVKFLPAEVLGRASGLLWLATGGAALLSPVVTPLLSEGIGARSAYAVLGLVTLPALAYLWRTWRSWDSAGAAGQEGTGYGDRAIQTAK
ncbi:MFS transporter, partial [Streptomyces sp. NPDC049577]|uniref:MFS transporter n=1 Tax=Streptomyces sp. NPDC049577 TaxID=3155153 RepID=UPI003423AAC8